MRRREERRKRVVKKVKEKAITEGNDLNSPKQINTGVPIEVVASNLDDMYDVVVAG